MVDVTRIALAVDSRQVRNARGELDGMQRSGQRAESAVSGLGRSLSNLKPLIPIASVVGFAMATRNLVNTFADFEQQMARVGAVSRASESDFRQLTEIAKELGSTTEFSASQAASGLEFLARAGWSAHESIKALPAVLDLATAASMELGSAANIASNIMSAYGIVASDAGSVSDILAAASSRANTNVEQLGDAMAYVGPIASALGISMGDTAAAVGALSDAGIQGSTAGTGLRRVLSSLANPTTAARREIERLGISLEDVNPATNELSEIVNRLSQSGMSAAQAMSIFGDRGGPAILALVENNAKVSELARELRNVEGESSRVAETVRDTLSGDLKALGSAFEGVQIAIGEAFSDDTRSVVQGFTSATRMLGENLDVIGYAASGVAVIVAGRLTASVASSGVAFAGSTIQAIRYQSALASMAGVSRTTAVSLTALGAASRTASASMAFLGGPVGIAVITAGSIYAFRRELGFVGPDADEAAAAVDRVARSMNSISVERAKQELRSMSREYERAQDQMVIYGNQVERLTEQRDMLEQKRDAGGLSRSEERGLARVSNLLVDAQVNYQEAEKAVSSYALAVQDLNSIIDGTSFGDIGDPFEAFDTKNADDAVQSVAAFSQAVQREIELLREHHALIEEGNSIKSAAQQMDERRLAIKLEEQDASAAQIEEMISLNRAIAEAEESARHIDNMNDALDRMRDQIDPMSQLNNAMRELREIFEAGLVDESEFEKIRDGLEKALAPIKDIDLSKPFEDGVRESQKAFRTMQRMLDDGSKGYAALEVAIQATNAVQAISAVLNQAQGEPYSAPARMAAMAAAVASIAGVAISLGGLGGSFTDTAKQRQDAQGTGSVFGMLDEKTESIVNSSEITANATRELVGINRGMLDALRQMQSGITSATAVLARGAGNLEFDYSGMFSVNENIFSHVSDRLPGDNILLDAIGKILGGSAKVTDQGVQILGGTLAEMMENVMLQAYQETQSKKYSWSSTKTSTAFSEVSDEVGAQFSLIFESIADSVFAGAQALGISAAEVERRINEFEIATQMISLHDLDAKEQQAELEAVFGSIFDGLAGSVFPFIDRFQRVGEGLGETLVRVATNVQVTEEAINRLGFSAERLGVEQFATLSTELIDAAGGLDRFISSMGNFIDRFASEQHKFETAQSDMARAFERLNLEVPQSRDAMWELMQTLDAGTESGRAQIAMLLELSSAADDYYRQIEKQQREAMRAVQGVAQAIKNELNGIRSAADNLRLQMGIGGSARESATEVLRQALLTGDMSGTGQAAQRAAQISADEFNSLADYRREQARTLFLLDSLEREGMQQLTTAEQSLNVLENIDSGIADIADILQSVSPQYVGPAPSQAAQTAEMSAPIVGGNSNALSQAMASNAELVKELREMKQYIRQTTKNTGETRDQLNRWNREGMPEERELV